MTVTLDTITIRAAHVPPDRDRLRQLARRAEAEDREFAIRLARAGCVHRPAPRSCRRRGSPLAVICLETGRRFESANEAAKWLGTQVGRKIYAHGILRSVTHGVTIEGHRFAAEKEKT